MTDIKLGQAIQEDLLTLLVYDKTSTPLLIQNLDVDLFDSFIYRNIAQKAINFYLSFKSPIADHLANALEEELTKTGSKSSASLYKEVLICLHENKNSVNSEYILSELNSFIRVQKLKIALIEASELLEAGKVQEAETCLEKNRKTQLQLFNPGTFLYEHDKVLEFLSLSENFIPTGIPQLDNVGICPAPKELFGFAALSGKGKSWWFIQLARVALSLRYKVLLVTMEMGESRMYQRYIQSIFAYAKRNEEVEIPIFTSDELNRLYDIDFKTTKPKGTFENPRQIKADLKSKLSLLRNQNFLIKEFPTRSLTIPALIAYLENLISFSKFHPHLILIDSPDNMKHDVKYKTDSLEHTYEDLRGIASSYNLACCVVSQINRGGKNVLWLDDENLAGAYAKMWVCDNLITYNQTDLEYSYNLARLLVAKGRNDKKGMKILISQNYSMGQFCLDSVAMSDKYNTILKSYDNNIDAKGVGNS